MARQKQKNALDHLSDSEVWVERLLELFWTIDEQMKLAHDNTHLLPPSVRDAYLAAERARREL